MNRREILAAVGASSIISLSAFGQTTGEPADFAFSTGPVEDEDELWFLISSMEALIFVVSIADEPKSIGASSRAFSQYAVQLGEPKAKEIFNEALRSPDGLGRVKEGWQKISLATVNVSKVLAAAGENERLNRRLAGAFSRTSALLLARSAKNMSWWCECYGLRVIGC
jgi:hypothetical protein